MPKVMALDPGAERQGWIILDDGTEREKIKPPIHHALGYFGVPRNLKGSKDKKDNTPYQEYRLSLIDLWNEQTPILLERYEPDEVVNEIVPPSGGSGPTSIQLQLALTAITVVQSIARQFGIPVYQIGATAAKTRIGRGKKATKVEVRNGVFEIMPDLVEFKKEWTKVFEVSDAAAIGLTHLGYKNVK